MANPTVLPGVHRVVPPRDPAATPADSTDAAIPPPPRLPRFLWRDASTAQALIKGSELGLLPEGSSVVKAYEASGKLVRQPFSGQTRQDTPDGVVRWVGAWHLGDKIDPDALYRLTNPTPAELIVAHQKALARYHLTYPRPKEKQAG